MVTENIRLTGMVLHSPNLERLTSFYQGILGAEFKQEQHGQGPLHYSCGYGKNELLELYPSEAKVNPPSPSILFFVPSIESIKTRMGPYFERATVLRMKGMVECFDSDGRKVYLHEKKNEKYISLEEVVLNSLDIERLKPFYRSLLGIEPATYGYSDHSKSYVFGHHKAKIKLHSSKTTGTPPSPTLLLSTPQLDKIAMSMKAEIKESNEPEQKRYVRLSDQDGRKIFIYEQKSWWQKLF
ncbi:MAG: hypothetical protein Q8R47_02975 [Nanoarchaeota archaeon]|nr:hypothetical protein [Nanoarchaeota archaeon]